MPDTPPDNLEYRLLVGPPLPDLTPSPENEQGLPPPDAEGMPPPVPLPANTRPGIALRFNYLSPEELADFVFRAVRTI